MVTQRNPKFLWQEEFVLRGPKKPAIFRVGMAMANKDNGDGKGFFASAEEMVRATPYTLRPVKEAIAHLMASGWVERTQRGGRFGDKSVASEYRLRIPPVAQGAGSSTLETSQGAEDRSQGAQSGSQGAGSSTPLDPPSLDPLPLDPSISEEAAINPEAHKAPCFCDDGGCELCMTVVAAQEDEQVLYCIPHGGGVYLKAECQHCFNDASRKRAEDKHSVERRRGRHETQNVSEALNRIGDGADSEQRITHYVSRSRY